MSSMTPYNVAYYFTIISLPLEFFRGGVRIPIGIIWQIQIESWCYFLALLLTTLGSFVVFLFLNWCFQHLPILYCLRTK